MYSSIIKLLLQAKYSDKYKYKYSLNTFKSKYRCVDQISAAKIIRLINWGVCRESLTTVNKQSDQQI